MDNGGFLMVTYYFTLILTVAGTVFDVLFSLSLIVTRLGSFIYLSFSNNDININNTTTTTTTNNKHNFIYVDNNNNNLVNFIIYVDIYKHDVNVYNNDVNVYKHDATNHDDVNNASTND